MSLINSITYRKFEDLANTGYRAALTGAVVGAQVDMVIALPDITYKDINSRNGAPITLPATEKMFICSGFRLSTDSGAPLLVHLGFKNATVSTGATNFNWNTATRTITRTGGNWIADGFVVGMNVVVTLANTVGNNGAYVVSGVTDTVLTMAAGHAITSDAADTAAVFTCSDASKNFFSGYIGGAAGSADKVFELGDWKFGDLNYKLVITVPAGNFSYSIYGRITYEKQPKGYVVHEGDPDHPTIATFPPENASYRGGPL